MHLGDMSRAYLPFQGNQEDDIESVNMVCYLPISDELLDESRVHGNPDRPSLQSLAETIPVV